MTFTTLSRVVGFVVLAGFLGACKTIPLHEDAKTISLVFSESTVSRCRFLENIVGSYGHWYSYLFINNDVLTQGAVNDLLNKAMNAHADTVFVPRLVNQFKTSVTIFGQAFQCRGRNAS